MKGLLIGDYKELFSKEQFKDLASRFGFHDIDQSYSALNELYTFYTMYLDGDAGLSRKGVKTAYRAISGDAKKLAQSLDIPLFESALLHSKSQSSRQDVLTLLDKLSTSAEALADSVEADNPGRRMSVENQFLLDLCDLYKAGTGKSINDIIFNPSQDEKRQYKGDSLSFLKHCIDKADIWKTDAALVQLIKRNQKHK